MTGGAGHLRRKQVNVELRLVEEPTLPESALIDCLLPAILAGIACVPALGNNLVLKGGSALRQFYFGDARFSNDLDFSALSQLPAGGELVPLVQVAALHAQNRLAAERHMRLYAVEAERPFKPVPMRSFQFIYEWHHAEQIRIALEISLDETIVRSPERMTMVRESAQDRAGSNNTCLAYTLEEVVAEKLRALLQWTRQVKELGRNDMPVARTYFDLLFLLKKGSLSVEGPQFSELLADKCRVRNVAFRSADCFFAPELVAVTEARWHEQLSPVLFGDIPDCKDSLSELRSLLRI